MEWFNGLIEDLTRPIPFLWFTAPRGGVVLIVLLFLAFLTLIVFKLMARLFPGKTPPAKSASRPAQRPATRPPASRPKPPAQRPQKPGVQGAARPAQRPQAQPAQRPSTKGTARRAERPQAQSVQKPSTKGTARPPQTDAEALGDPTPAVPSSTASRPTVRRGGRLGGGGLGDVYRATFEGSEVALKVMKADEDSPKHHEKRLRLFTREVELLADLDGRGTLPRLHTKTMFRDAEGNPFFLMELIEGETLKKQVEGGKLLAGSGEISPLLLATSSALAELHERHIVHRDLNPGNVMLSSSGPRLIDVGVGKRLTPTTTSTYAVYGTPAYLSKEAALGQPPTTETDVFGWGLTIAFAVTGMNIYHDSEDRLLLVDAALATFDPVFFQMLDEVGNRSSWHRHMVSIIRSCVAEETHDRPKDGLDLLVAAKALEKVSPATPAHGSRVDHYISERSFARHLMRGMSEAIAARTDRSIPVTEFAAECLTRLLRIPFASAMLQRGIAPTFLNGVFIEPVVPAGPGGVHLQDPVRSPHFWESRLRELGMDVEQDKDGLLVFSKPEMQKAR